MKHVQPKSIKKKRNANKLTPWPEYNIKQSFSVFTDIIFSIFVLDNSKFNVRAFVRGECITLESEYVSICVLSLQQDSAYLVRISMANELRERGRREVVGGVLPLEGKGYHNYYHHSLLMLLGWREYTRLSRFVLFGPAHLKVRGHAKPDQAHILLK